MYHEVLPDHVPVECWSAVRVSDLERQIDEVRRHFDIVSIDQLLSGRDGGADRPRVVLTFDDGNLGNWENLLPVVNRQQVPAAVFVATGQVQSGRAYWFDRVINALQVHKTVELDLRRHGLGRYRVLPPHSAINWREIQRLLSDIKQAGVSRNDELADAVSEACRGITRGGPPALQPLNVQQLQELARSPWLSIGAHSHCHRLLTQIPLADAETSINESRLLLERWTGKKVNDFAYPSGDHNDTLRASVERMGFRSAFTTTESLWRVGTDPYAIPRMGVGRYDSLDRFRLNLTGGIGNTVRRLVAAES
jgi:peptidoglycan/xylan/chitin deacetylase (PgdA/CDA1 family)